MIPIRAHFGAVLLVAFSPACSDGGGGCESDPCFDGEPQKDCAVVNDEARCVLFCESDDDCTNPEYFSRGCTGVDDKGRKFCR